MICSHQKTSSRWVTTDYFGEDIGGRWEYTTEYTIIDLDTHRYKCVQCNQIMYYSSAAREYYETGVDRKGLFQ